MTTLSVPWRIVPPVDWAERYPSERLAPPDPCWPSRYTQMTSGLTSALGDEWSAEHVGSTSVPGLLAKPVIDIALRAPEGRSPNQFTATFERAGWTDPRGLGDHWATFFLVDQVRAGIGHIFSFEQWPQAHVRLFAGWLRDHPDDRDHYAALKRSLVDRGIWGSEYTQAKSRFVLDIVNHARTVQGLAEVPGPL